jgi:hypothetical protein
LLWLVGVVAVALLAPVVGVAVVVPVDLEQALGCLLLRAQPTQLP